ncbi:MAG: hypothetical protein RMY28_001210 [Nostoc sp. ChiSLP01]|nr:hypothetical protein [Nostoc sp. CmiSLP01]MDZ8289114.1 hypothetical protein [Nostoc sp. ChiSLP01]
MKATPATAPTLNRDKSKKELAIFLVRCLFENSISFYRRSAKAKGIEEKSGETTKHER